jgi:hypothetical protein
VFLSDVFIQCAWAHPRGKRSFAFHAFLHGVVEKVGHEGDYSIFLPGLSRREANQKTGAFDARFPTNCVVG